jgi:superfamily II DNA/RNA helicase
VVLDEADRMLDEGFEPAIRKIMGFCPEKASTPGKCTEITTKTELIVDLKKYVYMHIYMLY